MKLTIPEHYQILRHERFGTERALYGSRALALCQCRFTGDEDGESALKESRDIWVEHCLFDLRYPFWHDRNLTVLYSEMTEKCRAPLWYSEGVCIEHTKMHGVKALRECRDVTMFDCEILSPEFGWMSRNISLRASTAEGEYFMLRCEELRMEQTLFRGKYSFQYIQNATIENCVLDTKDAFWHAKNVTVKECTVKGEYLAWYAENITFDHCKIIGTQPFCYCKNLTLIDCEMIDCDLAFEKSEVNATVTSPVHSIKNPRTGRITAPSVGELIMDDPEALCEIITP